MRWIEDNLFPLIPALLLVVLMAGDVKFHIEFKFDTILLIVGNLGIALYIASAINKKLKNEELRINNCFKELEFLQDLLSGLSDSILEKNANMQDDITRFMSLIMLQIELIKRYDFIKQIHRDKLSDHYYILSKNLTDSDVIDEDYKRSLLQLEREILNIKSSIL